MDNRGKKSGKARIPDHLRRRALVSCDRCKKRRIRCLRSTGSDANDACQSCMEVGVTCESTLPRKTRIYGSVETLSVRYRVLDALIKGLYPDKDTNNIESLYAIAKANEISIPTFDEQTVAEEVFSAAPKQSISSPHPSAGSPSTNSKESENLNISDGKAVIEEKLVPMPNHGPSHYIGPSSSFGFVLLVRNMVAEFNAALQTIQPEDEKTRIASDFGGSNWSKALEPINKDESDESSEDNIDRNLNGSSNQARMPNRRAHKPSIFHPAGESSMSSRLKKITVLSLIPSKEVTDTFLNAFFEKVHPNYLVFHRPTFQARYDSMWSHPHLQMRDMEAGWICCIFMTLVFGAQVLEDRDSRQSKQIQKHYLDLVQARMHQLISSSTLVNVQALLLLQLYQHNNTERNSAFMLLGCASRMAMALGMHREGTSGGFGEVEKEVRKRVWWTAYSFEQYQCAILGRPCAIDDAEVNITFPDEKLLDGETFLPASYVEYSIRLTKLLSDIRRKMYAAPSPNQQGDSPKMSIAVQFLMDLDSWHQSLPPSLRLENLSTVPKHRRAVLLLHVQFHHIQSLVTRPFILRKVGVQLARKLGRHVRSQDLDKEEIALSDACGTFCRQATLLLHQLLVTGQFDGVTWLDAYYIYHSVFILALDFLARPWEQQDTPEDIARKNAVRDITAALKETKLCATFMILTQVSHQLAKIVGIFDVESQEPPKTQAYTQFPGLLPAGGFVFDYGSQQVQAGNNAVMHDWFQKDPTGLPWDLKDFFGTDSYVGNPDPTDRASMAGMTLGGIYSNHLPGVIDEDIGPPDVPPHTAYSHWRQINTPFSQPPQPHMPPGPMP